MVTIAIGDKVSYRFEGKWREGIVHGTKTHEKPDGEVTQVSYLIDTGEDLRVDEYAFNPRQSEINRRVEKLVKSKGKDHAEALAEVSKQKDLPESKHDVEKVRQPVLIEVDQAEVKPL